MFLALKELKHSKTKFALIIVVIVLISYLVYFLTALAYGLATSYTDAIEAWEADQIVMTEDANDSMMMSYLTEEDYQTVDERTDGDLGRLGLFPGVMNNPYAENEEENKINVYFFGIEEDSIIQPETFDQDNEPIAISLSDKQVIADQELVKKGFKIGDKLKATGSNQEFEIVAFSQNTRYQTAPVIYMSLDTWKAYRFGEENTPETYNGLIVKGALNDFPDHLKVYLPNEYMATLPGYTAQVLTFGVMIGFLIFIAAFVLAIFIYVLTIQKTSMFGVMKAQGISNAFIGKSVIIQTFLLVLIGVVLGLVLTLVSGYFLADLMPFAINILFYIFITLAFFIFAFFGALFSVNAVLKIDPLNAIGA